MGDIMPRGIANLFSILPSIELLQIIEVLLNTKEIKLELPKSNKVQVWSSDGEMLQVEKEELYKKSTDLSNYLIQFWWPQMDDISIKLAYEGQLCVCDIYLDGLSESQFEDILDLLISVTMQSFETVGFVVDRRELSSEFEWTRFFTRKEQLESHYLEQYGLKVYKEYEIKDGNRDQLKDYGSDYVYVVLPNREKGKIILYLLG